MDGGRKEIVGGEEKTVIAEQPPHLFLTVTMTLKRHVTFVSF